MAQRDQPCACICTSTATRQRPRADQAARSRGGRAETPRRPNHGGQVKAPAIRTCPSLSNIGCCCLCEPQSVTSPASAPPLPASPPTRSRRRTRTDTPVSETCRTSTLCLPRRGTPRRLQPARHSLDTMQVGLQLKRRVSRRLRLPAEPRRYVRVHLSLASFVTMLALRRSHGSEEG